MNDMSTFRETIEGLVNDGFFQFETAQVQAKSLLSTIALTMPEYRWTYHANRLVRNLTITTFELEAIARSDLAQLTELSSEARKLAQVWESLSHLEESTSTQTALLNASILYDLAGYQANAMCLARQLEAKETSSEQPDLLQLGSLFIQRRFLRLRDLSEQAQREPNPEGGISDEFLDIIGLALLAKSLSHAAAFLLSGRAEESEQSSDLIQHAYSVFSSSNSVSGVILSRSLQSLLPLIASRSTWHLLHAYHSSSPRWGRYLKLLARGTGSDVYNSRSISELWPSQIVALKEGLLERNSNKIVKMPTSAGKTRIAELAIVHTLVKNPKSKCIYIAPYRALVSEVEGAFLRLLRDLGFRVASVAGVTEDYNLDDFEESLFRDTSVLVATPEKLDLIVRARPEFLDSVELVVLDEGHIVGGLGRGIKIELLLTRLKERSKDAKFLILSAVISQETLEDFAKWFNASPDRDILKSDWRPAVQRLARFEWRGRTGVVRYSTTDISVLDEFVPGVIRQQEFSFVNPQTRRRNTRRFPDPSSKAQVAAELAVRFAELGPVLVFCTQPNWVGAVAGAIEERLRYSKLTGEDIPNYFKHNPDTRSSQVCKEWFGTGELPRWLASGIAIHHGQLPSNLREAIEVDFRAGKYRVLVATNTLAQGVNLPIKTVIVHSCRRYNGETDAMERIPASDYWNIAGRAGRAGEETEGLILHIVDNETARRDFDYFQSKKSDIEPVRSALFQRLLDLMNDRLSREAFQAKLDPEILVLLSEESVEQNEFQLLDDILEGSLTTAQISRDQEAIWKRRLETEVKDIARQLVNKVGDSDLRQVYGLTGLGSDSCELLREKIIENEQQTVNILTNSTQQNMGEVVDFLLPICLQVSEMAPRTDFGGSYTDLLKGWISGSPVQTLADRYLGEEDKTLRLGNFIDDLFRYKLPWGIASFIRIAQHILNLNRNELSEYMRFFPSMVKFGVSDIAACWAMAVGIPTRKVATDLALAFEDNAHTIHHRDFLEWLSRLDSEQLSNEFRLEGFVLEDTSRSIFVSSINPLLQQYTGLDILPREVWVQGIQYENRSNVARRIRMGDEVRLIRDYDNLVDRNAIFVSFLNERMGYIPREEAEVLAPELDSGSSIKGTVTQIEIENGNIPKVSIELQQ